MNKTIWVHHCGLSWEIKPGMLHDSLTFYRQSNESIRQNNSHDTLHDNESDHRLSDRKRSRPWSHHKVHLLAILEHMIFITSCRRVELVWLSWTCGRTNNIFSKHFKELLGAISCFYFPLVFLLSSPSLGERCPAVLLWSSRNITRTTKLQSAFPSAESVSK